MPGWSEDISNVRTLDELPANARRYVDRVSELTGIPIAIFSVGRNREQTNQVKPIF
ncbi:Adenylosuccinate synthetase [compost metagenome]